MKRIIFFQILCFSIAINTTNAQIVGVAIHEHQGDYALHKDFVEKARIELQAILNSTEFKDAVLAGEFTQTNDLTNEQLFQTILLAHEAEGPGGTDNVVDLRLRSISVEQDGRRWVRNCKPNSWAGTIGKDDAGSGMVATCPYRINNWVTKENVGAMAGHFMHEYLHQLEFHHYGRRKSGTAVYQIGDLVASLSFGRRRDQAVDLLLENKTAEAKVILSVISQWDDDRAWIYKSALKEMDAAAPNLIAIYQKILAKDKTITPETKKRLEQAIGN